MLKLKLKFVFLKNNFFFLEKWKPSKCSLDDLFRAVQVTIIASMREPTTQICGGMVVFDFDGLALSHVMQFTPSFAAMLLEWVQVTHTMKIGQKLINVRSGMKSFGTSVSTCTMFLGVNCHLGFRGWFVFSYYIRSFELQNTVWCTLSIFYESARFNYATNIHF